MSLRIELSLREKRDHGGAAYLFAPIPLINCVCFVFDEPPRNQVRRAKLVLKPYEGGKAGASGEWKAAWAEEDLDKA